MVKALPSCDADHTKQIRGRMLLAHGRPGAYPGISTLEDMYQACNDFFAQFVPGPKAILLKGGHVRRLSQM